jgi:hypothetical protein
MSRADHVHPLVDPGFEAMIYVDPNGEDKLGGGSFLDPYQTVQFAIDQATSGATIVLNSGTYVETVICDKTCTIVGSGQTFIEGDTADYPGLVITNCTNASVNTWLGHGSANLFANWGPDLVGGGGAPLVKLYNLEIRPGPGVTGYPLIVVGKAATPEVELDNTSARFTLPGNPGLWINVANLTIHYCDDIGDCDIPGTSEVWATHSVLGNIVVGPTAATKFYAKFCDLGTVTMTGCPDFYLESCVISGELTIDGSVGILRQVHATADLHVSGAAGDVEFKGGHVEGNFTIDVSATIAASDVHFQGSVTLDTPSAVACTFDGGACIGAYTDVSVRGTKQNGTWPA